jgi:hypothetical protein
MGDWRDARLLAPKKELTVATFNVIDVQTNCLILLNIPKADQ